MGSHQPVERRTESIVTGDFLFMCGGYYNYDEAYRPEFPGQAHSKAR